MSFRDSNGLPAKRSRWRHPMLRGVWVVARVGTKYVTLSSTIPTLGPTTVPLDQWPGDWSQA